MEGRITEELVTTSIINWLLRNSWEIVCYDFPQSGTGKILHPNVKKPNSKNKDSIIPDIVAIKNNSVVYFENKDRFLLSDFKKVNYVKTTNCYSKSFNTLLRGNKFECIYCGIGLPDTLKNRKKILANTHLINFAILVIKSGVIIFYDPYNIFTKQG